MLFSLKLILNSKTTPKKSRLIKLQSKQIIFQKYYHNMNKIYFENYFSVFGRKINFKTNCI